MKRSIIIFLSALGLSSCAGNSPENNEATTAPTVTETPAKKYEYDVWCAPVIYQNSGVSMGVSMRVTNIGGVPGRIESLTLTCDEIPEYTATKTAICPDVGANITLFIGIFSDNKTDTIRTYRAKNKDGKTWEFKVSFQRSSNS